MITTTANHVRTLARPGTTLWLRPMAAALLLASLPAHADVRVTPGVLMSATWTDNIELSSDATARSDLVTQVSPMVTLSNDSRRLHLDAVAQLHQFAYLHHAGNNNASRQTSYRAQLRSEVVSNFFYVDASASRGLSNVSAFGPQVSNDLYALGNRSEISTWTVSPYFAHRFGHTADAVLRYTADEVRSNRNDAFARTSGSSVMASLTSGASFNTLGWGVNYYKQDLQGSRYGDSSSESLSANLRYRVSRSLALTAKGGYDRYDFEGPSDGDEGANWALGFVWTPSQRTSLAVSSGHHYYGSTGSLALTHRSRHTVWDVSYSDTITTSRQQFLLPATVNTADLLDRLFSSTYPDAGERARVVQAYIQNAGLPSALTDSVNYLSNRFMRQKMLRASMAMRRARSNAVVSLYASERNALSDVSSDAPLLGNQNSYLNDNVRQRGIDATYVYQLNSRSHVSAGMDFSRTESLTTKFNDFQRTLRLGASRRFGKNTVGQAEIRQRSGDLGPGREGSYRERAIAASLSMQF